MLSVISSTVKGVTGATLPAPKPTPFFRKKFAGGARRALAALGPNNTQLNMNMAKTHLAMAQEGFAKQWNFNPVNEVPLASGRYQWTLLVSGSENKLTPTTSENVAKDPILLQDITNPILTTSPVRVVSDYANVLKTSQTDQDNKYTVPTSTNNQENAEHEVITEIECKQQVLSPSTGTIVVPVKSLSSNSQNCITDFFRQQKRKSGYLNDTCLPCPNTPPKKKSRSIH